VGSTKYFGRTVGTNQTVADSARHVSGNRDSGVEQAQKWLRLASSQGTNRDFGICRAHNLDILISASKEEVEPSETFLESHRSQKQEGTWDPCGLPPCLCLMLRHSIIGND
jgi:hypothetical protein